MAPQKKHLLVFESYCALVEMELATCYEMEIE